ncbi:MAG: YheC/YheD family protein [Syntrophomonadaceae bacterium]|jgi:glutathione synthase/RimK-type ligase-like ATP-grasp enzyme
MSNIIGQIVIGHRLRQRYQIPSEDTATVRVGCRFVTSKMTFSEGNDYILSPDLTRALYLSKGHKLRFRYDSGARMIHLGPTVGILATSLPNRLNPSPTSVQAELVYLSQLGKTLRGQVFVFTPSGIDWQSQTVRGYNYKQGASSERGVWTAAIYPLPDVVYDRVPSRRREAQPIITETKRKLLATAHVKYFNPAFLNKWQVYQVLSQNPSLSLHLPETRLLNPAQLEAMLEKYAVLFLKPCNGSLGKGIIYVKKSKNQKLQYIAYPGGRIKGTSDTAGDLLERTATVRKGRPYLVQEGLDLAKYNGSAFDIRIIYQKNGWGEWQTGKKFARIAPHGSNISNLSSGGSFEKMKRLMNRLYRRETRRKKYALIKELCKTVALTLESHSQGIYGELGLDIGMGKNGIPYLIEVNSKPRKTTHSLVSQDVVAKTFRRPLEFACYLAGFPQKKP